MARNSKNETEKLKEAMLDALERFHGNVRNAAETAEVSERTHYRWCREDNAYNNAVGSLRDIRLRHAKDEILEIAMRKLEDGNITVLNKMLAIFYKNFHEELRLSNFYNDDPHMKEGDKEYE